MPRALFIDAAKQTVTEIEMPRHRALEKLQELANGFIECATEFPNGDVLYVNEEGLLHNPEHFFDIGAHQPFAGNGVIVGAEEGDEGDLMDAQTAIADLKVTWLSPSEAYMRVQRPR